MNISLNPKVLIVLILSLGLAFSSCKKDEDKKDSSNNGDNPSSAPTENRLSCDVDGMTYVFDQDFTAIYVEIAGIKSLTINAKTANGEELTASINLWTGITGDFQMQSIQSSNYASITWFNASDESWSCPNSINGDNSNLVSGDFSIDYYDVEKVSGTFSGTIASNNTTTTFPVTNGVFSAITIN